ncbi:hypothetical protein [Prescottella agglutinans]|uniref:Uncharacterized protein n=1 Tax=Prescottella agglutinans TaxID=1644129 RepID=A0ABT6MJN0_9NOCA|nr:hypothetical protein [Prescottella agglutinans]MDH6284497.1 hypothetical protein [Prescottella agglutinans]
MLNTSAAQAVTISHAGESIIGDIVEVLDITTSDAGMFVAVLLADGRKLEGPDAVDAQDIKPRLTRQLATAAA